MTEIHPADNAFPSCGTLAEQLTRLPAPSHAFYTAGPGGFLVEQGIMLGAQQLWLQRGFWSHSCNLSELSYIALLQVSLKCSTQSKTRLDCFLPAHKYLLACISPPSAVCPTLDLGL